MRYRLLKQANRAYGPRPRLALLVVAGVIFVIILPLALLLLGGRLEHWLDWTECWIGRRCSTHRPMRSSAGS